MFNICNAFPCFASNRQLNSGKNFHNFHFVGPELSKYLDGGQTGQAGHVKFLPNHLSLSYWRKYVGKISNVV